MSDCVFLPFLRVMLQMQQPPAQQPQLNNMDTCASADTQSPVPRQQQQQQQQEQEQEQLGQQSVVPQQQEHQSVTRQQQQQQHQRIEQQSVGVQALPDMCSRGSEAAPVCATSGVWRWGACANVKVGVAGSFAPANV